VKPEATQGKNAIFFRVPSPGARAAFDRWPSYTAGWGQKKYTPSAVAAARQLVSGCARCCCQICAWNDGTRTFWPGKLMPVLYSVRKNVRASPKTYNFRRPRRRPPIHFFFPLRFIQIYYGISSSFGLSPIPHLTAPDGNPQTLVLFFEWRNNLLLYYILLYKLTCLYTPPSISAIRVAYKNIEILW